MLESWNATFVVNRMVVSAFEGDIEWFAVNAGCRILHSGCAVAERGSSHGGGADVSYIIQ